MNNRVFLDERASFLIASRNWTTISRTAGRQPSHYTDCGIPAFVGNSVVF